MTTEFVVVHLERESKLQLPIRITSEHSQTEKMIYDCMFDVFLITEIKRVKGSQNGPTPKMITLKKN